MHKLIVLSGSPYVRNTHPSAAYVGTQLVFEVGSQDKYQGRLFLAALHGTAFPRHTFVLTSLLCYLVEGDNPLLLV